ncbi:MAG: hypothetical protein ACE3L7_33760 [Candidatus Pristimantibacillus sp.]
MANNKPQEVPEVNPNNQPPEIVPPDSPEIQPDQPAPEITPGDLPEVRSEILSNNSTSY